jgi:hypothetical protein
MFYIQELNPPYKKLPAEFFVSVFTCMTNVMYGIYLFLPPMQILTEKLSEAKSHAIMLSDIHAEADEASVPDSKSMYIRNL